VKRNKYIFLFLRFAVVAGGIIFAVIWLSSEQRWLHIKQIFSQMNLLIFAANICIFIIGHIIIGFRWWLLLRTQAIFIPFWASVKLYLLGWFYNNVMPSSFGGDVIRAWYVTKHTEKKLQAVLSIFVDRLIGLLSTFVIAAFFYLLFLRHQDLSLRFSGTESLLKSISRYRHLLFYALVAVAAIFCAVIMAPKGRLILIGAWKSIYQRLRMMFQKFKKAAVLYCSSPLTVLAVFCLTILMQIMTITGFWFLGTSLGIHVSIKYYYVFFTLTWVLGVVPISIGGAVVVEGLLAYMFINFANVQPEAAVALVLSQRIVWIIGSLPGAVIHLIGAHLPKDIIIDYNQTEIST
jgi:uncharacterized protein (TIRG00374 family)